MTYDAMGNITSLGDYSYTWTGGRQLKSVTSEDQHFEYFYNADGKLEKYDMYDVITSQPINGENTETIRYSGTVYYFWNEDSLVSMCLEEDGQLLYNIRIVYDADGEAMGICLNDRGTFLYQKDLQGDIVALISPDGQIVLEYIYDSYGNFSVSTPDNSVGSAFLAMFILALNPLSYRGYLYAPGIGVSYYLGSRFYSPQICRFMNADVYQDTGTGAVGTNMFAYCDNSPINYYDPLGTAKLNIMIKLLLFKVDICLYYYIDYDSNSILSDSHIDISIGGQTFSYGTSNARISEKLTGVQGYLYVGETDDWLKSTAIARYDEIKKVTLKTSRSNQLILFLYLLSFMESSCKIAKKSIYPGINQHKVTKGSYKSYSYLFHNCATFARDLIDKILRPELSRATSRLYGAGFTPGLLITPASVYLVACNMEGSNVSTKKI